ncbi:UNVERIFIED_CONTAM: Retrovirus-related Pol polyprotein from transposon TNT 1-94 [Sesamum indicum]
MKSEIDSMGSNQVWTIGDPPKGVQPVGCKWVYKRNQFARSKGKSILLVIAASFIEEQIYVDQPKGFTTARVEQKVCRLQRSIYGLKQASQSWIINFGEVIRGYDFIKNKFDPCAYKKISRSSVMYLVLDVDDILLIGNDVKILGNKKDGYPLNFPWRIWVRLLHHWYHDLRIYQKGELFNHDYDIQKQYDRLDDVPSIMLYMKEVYAVPDRHLQYAAKKAFFGTKMAEGSSVQSHMVKMFSLVEKLENLKARLDNDTYIDVILQ